MANAFKKIDKGNALSFNEEYAFFGFGMNDLEGAVIEPADD